MVSFRLSRLFVRKDITLPVIVVSGKFDRRDLIRLFKLSVVDILLKETLITVSLIRSLERPSNCLLDL